MPKSRGRRQPPRLPPPVASPLPPALPPATLALGYDPNAPQKARDIVGTTPSWSEYRLDDGVTIRVKGVLVDAKRMIDQFDNAGQPIYMTQLSVVTEVVAPQEMMKPKAGTAQSAKTGSREEKK